MNFEDSIKSTNISKHFYGVYLTVLKIIIRDKNIDECLL